jgi:transposase
MARSRKEVESSGRRERRKFTDEFKREAIRLMYDRRASGVPLSQVARDIGVSAERLRVWEKVLRDRNDDSLPDRVETPEQELRRLRRENMELRQEREFAKKVAVYFAKESH